jgi:peptidoglycan/xylan/chitin deacetylase (PgdA/CDA1 family)
LVSVVGRFLALVALASCGNGLVYRDYEYLRDDIEGAVPPNAIAEANHPGVVYWHGDRTKPRIALTFDDGPSPYTPQVLAVLDRYHVKATFFMIGQRVEQHPDLARSVVAAGHVIANHTYDHRNLVLDVERGVTRELAKAETAITGATGLIPRMFRPPYGAADRYTFDASHRAGYVGIEWSDSSKDWLRPGVDVIVRHVLAHASNGAIVLMHDGGGDRSQTVAALDKIIPELQRRGFELVTIPDLLGIAPYAEGPHGTTSSSINSR